MAEPTRTFRCSRPECTGIVVASHETAVRLRTGCHSFTSAFPCTGCGLLHFGEGFPARSQNQLDPFLEPGDKTMISLRDAQGVEQMRHPVGL